MVKVNLAYESFVEENESAALSADLVQFLLDDAKEEAEERQPFGTAHARLTSGVPARMGSKVRSLARQAIALRSMREKNPEDPEQWAERITKSIYGE
ncbi:hypothetical protein [Paraburkholderia terricola]|uniref:hypothetical protein n=1 Tax=Paraburkholderia terricola TaxID=169427 RepID=UPI003F4FE144